MLIGGYARNIERKRSVQTRMRMNKLLYGLEGAESALGKSSIVSI